MACAYHGSFHCPGPDQCPGFIYPNRSVDTVGPDPADIGAQPSEAERDAIEHADEHAEHADEHADEHAEHADEHADE